jgi:xanthine dehydrogenase accessory factor
MSGDREGTLAGPRDANEAAVLVTVAATRGSVPREAGTKMIVTADAVHGTIGGGHLEHQAIAIARSQLGSDGEQHGAMRRFPLGASLGQCCGGIVELLFEPIAGTAEVFAERVRRVEFTVVLFGAGHVGRALVRVLAELPCRIVWVDEREAQFPRDIPANARVLCTDAPEEAIDEAPPGAHFLVMTHSHALDERLAERILQRGDYAYFGLIGSQPKRRAFEKRLAHRGMPAERLATMTCPIGIAGIKGKEPGIIAIAVAAQLLQVRADFGVRAVSRARSTTAARPLSDLQL